MKNNYLSCRCNSLYSPADGRNATRKNHLRMMVWIHNLTFRTSKFSFLFSIHPSVFQLSHLPLQCFFFFFFQGGFWSLPKQSIPGNTQRSHTFQFLSCTFWTVQTHGVHATVPDRVLNTQAFHRFSIGSFQLLLDTFLSAKVSAEDRGFSSSGAAPLQKQRRSISRLREKFTGELLSLRPTSLRNSWNYRGE